MSPRAAFALLLLGSCGDPDAARRTALAEAEETSGRIECAVDGAALERVCTVERVAGPEGLSLTIRAPSGSFRRFLVTTDGRGVVAADGADPALVTPVAADRIEVAIASDRYLLPAMVKQ